jgi:hypothetical protein
MKAVNHINDIMFGLNCGKPMFTWLQLVHGILRPALCYGAQIVSPGYLLQHAGSTSLDKVLHSQLRRILGVGRGVPREVLLRECGQMPLMFDIIRDICSFWNTAVTSGSPLLMNVLVHNVNLGIQGNTKVFWSYQLHNVLTAVCPNMTPCSGTVLLHKQQLHTKCILQHYANYHLRALHSIGAGDPSSPIVLHRKFVQYWNWWDTHHCHPVLPWYVSHVHSRDRQRLLAQMRCGASPVVAADALTASDVPWGERRCFFCHNDVGNIPHLLLHCPALEPWRSTVDNTLFLLHDDVRAFTLHADQHLVVTAVSTCLLWCLHHMP